MFVWCAKVLKKVYEINCSVFEFERFWFSLKLHKVQKYSVIHTVALVLFLA